MLLNSFFFDLLSLFWFSLVHVCGLYSAVEAKPPTASEKQQQQKPDYFKIQYFMFNQTQFYGKNIQSQLQIYHINPSLYFYRQLKQKGITGTQKMGKKESIYI